MDVLYWNISSVLEHPYWLNSLYWNIFKVLSCLQAVLVLGFEGGHRPDYMGVRQGMFYTGISLRTEYFVLEYPYGLNVLYWNVLTDWIFCTLGYPYGLNILYWNIPAAWTFCTGIFLLPEYFVLWDVLTDWIFCTGISLLLELFVLEYSYCLNIWYLTDWIFGAEISLRNEYLVLKVSTAATDEEIHAVIKRKMAGKRSISFSEIANAAIGPYWNIPAGWICVLEYPYWLDILYWNIFTDLNISY